MIWPILAVLMLVLIPAFHLAAWLVRDYNSTRPTLQEWNRKTHEGNQQTPQPPAGGFVGAKGSPHD